MSDIDNVEYLKDAAEYGPRGQPIAEGLLGWWTPKQLFVCAKCASRIFGRGCQLPRASEPVWKGQPVSECCVCNETQTETKP